MLKQGTKLVHKNNGEKYHIGGVCGEIYFLVNSIGNATTSFTEKEILETFTIVEEKWEPKYGDMYFFINDYGNKSESCWSGDKRDIFRRDYLGIYQTKEEAQTARENMKKIS